MTFVHAESTPGIHSVVVVIRDKEGQYDYAVILYYIPPG